MSKVAFNISMISESPTGVGIYSRNLLNTITNQKNAFGFKCFSLNANRKKILSLRRIFWNIFILPIQARKSNLLFSFSTHGTPFFKRQIITVHDLICLNFPEQHRFQYYYFKYFVPIILKRCLKIVAISEFTKEEIIKFYKISPDKIVVIKNGANFEDSVSPEEASKVVKKLSKGKDFYLCVGASFTHKNTLNLIDALFRVQTERQIIILGKQNSYFEEVKQKAIAYGMLNVVFLEYVTDSILKELYKRAFCNLYVSLYEGFGFPPLEAAFFGKITIASNIPVMKEIYGDSLLYVDPHSIESITDVISNFDKGLIDTTLLKSKFPSILDKYSWEKTAAETTLLIEQCL